MKVKTVETDKNPKSCNNPKDKNQKPKQQEFIVASKSSMNLRRWKAAADVVHDLENRGYNNYKCVKR